MIGLAHLGDLGQMVTPLTPTSLSGSPSLHLSGAFSANLPSPVYPSSVPPPRPPHPFPFPQSHLPFFSPSIPMSLLTPSRPLCPICPLCHPLKTPAHMDASPSLPLNGKRWSAQGQGVQSLVLLDWNRSLALFPGLLSLGRVRAALGTQWWLEACLAGAQEPMCQECL